MAAFISLRSTSPPFCNTSLAKASPALAAKLSEMVFSSDFGIKIQKPKKLSNLFKYFFGEDQGRYILEIDNKNLQKVEKKLKDNNIYYEFIGNTQKDYFEIEGEMKITIKDLFKANNKWYNNY